MFSAISESASFIKVSGVDQPPLAGIVLGTGLGALVERMDIIKSIPYTKIPHFATSTVESHKGNLLYGQIGGVTVIAMQGRFHYYEGYTLQEITFPIRVMKELGIKYLFLCNAAGGLNPGYKKGDLVLIEDHINLLPDNPLRGLHDERYGNRFVDMSQPYDISLSDKLKKTAAGAGIRMNQGIYVSVMGPNLETRAEYRWLRSIGADMVGMSTVPEVIVANQVGIACAAISVITDECDPDNLKPIDIADIIAVAGEADKNLSEILFRVIYDLQA